MALKVRFCRPMEDDSSTAKAQQDETAQLFDEQVKLHEDLLFKQLQNSSQFSKVVSTIEAKMNGVNETMERLDNRIHVPFSAIQDVQSQMERLQLGAHLLRQLSRFLYLQQRLHGQMSSIKSPYVGTDVTQASITIREIESLVSAHNLMRLHIVNSEVEMLKIYRLRLIEATKSLYGQALGEKGTNSWSNK